MLPFIFNSLEHLVPKVRKVGREGGGAGEGIKINKKKLKNFKAFLFFKKET